MLLIPININSEQASFSSVVAWAKISDSVEKKNIRETTPLWTAPPTKGDVIFGNGGARLTGKNTTLAAAAREGNISDWGTILPLGLGKYLM